MASGRVSTRERGPRLFARPGTPWDRPLQKEMGESNEKSFRYDADPSQGGVANRHYALFSTHLGNQVRSHVSRMEPCRLVQ